MKIFSSIALILVLLQTANSAVIDSSISIHHSLSLQRRDDDSHLEDDDDDDDFSDEGSIDDVDESPLKNLPLCQNKCQFPITNLSLTEPNIINVTRFRKDDPSLIFWLNYTCPGSVFPRRFDINRLRGKGNVDFNRINKRQRPGNDSFLVRSWGALSQVGKTNNWTFALIFKDCKQVANFSFTTQNPFNIEKPVINSTLSMSDKNCTADNTESEPQSKAYVDDDGIANVNFTSSNSNVSLSIVELALKDRKKLKHRLGAVGKLIQNKQLNFSLDFKSIFDEKNNRTVVKFNFGKNRNHSGEVCVGVNVNDGVSGSPELKYFSVGMDSEAMAVNAKTSAASQSIPQFMSIFFIFMMMTLF
jgi:predicted dithiol-disulfide oxidoreductase (DUF899 family)